MVGFISLIIVLWFPLHACLFISVVMGVHRSKTSANYCEEEACLFFSMAFFLLYWCIIKELAGCEFSSLSGFL